MRWRRRRHHARSLSRMTLPIPHPNLQQRSPGVCEVRVSACDPGPSWPSSETRTGALKVAAPPSSWHACRSSAPVRWRAAPLSGSSAGSTDGALHPLSAPAKAQPSRRIPLGRARRARRPLRARPRVAAQSPRPAPTTNQHRSALQRWRRWHRRAAPVVEEGARTSINARPASGKNWWATAAPSTSATAAASAACAVPLRGAGAARA